MCGNPTILPLKKLQIASHNFKFHAVASRRLTHIFLLLINNKKPTGIKYVVLSYKQHVNDSYIIQ